MLNDTIKIWRIDLNRLIRYYDNRKSQIEHFFIYLFVFFIIINISCYWFAMITAFPYLVFGSTFDYYFKIQFPVGLLGALFDSFSFFITIYIIQKALKTTDDKVYIAHLSIDVLIAIIATFWVISVFIVSGWVVGFIETLNQPIAMIKRYDHETDLLARTNQYANTVNDAIKNPTRNLQNIYFGIIMGLSAMIPTSIHFSMFCRAVLTKIGFFGSLKNINN